MIEVLELIITGRRRSVHHFSQNHAILMILSGRRLTARMHEAQALDG